MTEALGKRRVLIGLGALVAIALSAWHFGAAIADAPPTTFDDSYIFVRYAKHILAGHGPAWDPGGEPTYGVTSLLYVLVVTALRWATDLTDAGLLRVASCGFGLAAIVVMVATAARFATAESLRGNVVLWAGLLVPATLASGPFVYHSLTGMDTTLALFMHSVLVWVTLRLVERGTARALWPVVLVGYLAYLARPDSAVYAALFPAAAILFLTGAPKRIRLLLAFWVALGLVLAVDAAVKVAVFGVPVPLPTYAKMHGQYGDYAGLALWNPVEYLLEFWAAVLPFACVAIGLATRRSLPLLLVFLVPAAVTLASYFNIVQIMGWRARFSFPSMPFFVMAGALCLDRFVTWWRAAPAAATGGLALASRVMAILAIVALTPVARRTLPPFYEQRVLARMTPRVSIENPGGLPRLAYWDAVAAMISIARAAPAGSVFCMSEYGRIGSEAPEVSILDPLGLQDERMAREGFSAAALFQHEPDFIWLPHHDYVAMRREILESEELWNDYDVYPGALNFGVAIRRTGPRADELDRLFGEVWRTRYPGVSMEGHRGKREPDGASISPRVPDLHLELCVREDGTATPTWTEGIAVAIGREEAEACARERRPLSPEARAWLEVLEDALPQVAAGAHELATPFGIEPFDAVVAAGNRCSSDGFGWVPRHVGINLEAFHRSYGAPGEEAVDRMRRIVAHEYVHLLTYAVYPDHRERRDTPWNRALWTLFFEGIGDYISVSRRWLPDERGNPSPVAAETLQRLEPVLVARLEAFLDATPEEEAQLREGISMGRFDEKWGSLPVALWLHAEARARGERETLAWMVRVGPDGVLPLALRHAAPEHRPRLQALAERARDPR